MTDVPKGIQELFPEEHTIPEELLIKKPLLQREYLVAGEIKLWQGPLQKVHSPICCPNKNGELRPNFIGSYPLLTEKESEEILNSALKAYNNGQGLWPTMSPADRIKCVETFLLKMQAKRDQVVKLLMWEIGKNLQDSQHEFDRTIAYIKDTIAALKEMEHNSSSFTKKQGVMAQLKRAPLGIVLCMGPFNYPLNETFTTLIPALIMGNVTIFKPPKMGVLLHRPLLEAFKESFPPGVVNTIYGEGQKVIAPLMNSGKIDVLAFIGTSRVADILKHQHPKPHKMRSILGLESKNAGIILADADLDLAVQESVAGALSYNGQRCTALKILFVHQTIAAEFQKRFAKKVSALGFGMPWEKDAKITPLPEPNKTFYLSELVKDAEKLGAQVINSFGGTVKETFFFPAVLSPVTKEMRIYQEEQFGPVVPIVIFNDIKTPIDYVVNSNYGQQVSIFGKDPGQVSSLIDSLSNQVCRINLNCQCQRGPDIFPFTGRKDSAEGTLSVAEALKSFSIETFVATKTLPTNERLLGDLVQHSNFLSLK